MTASPYGTHPGGIDRPPLRRLLEWLRMCRPLTLTRVKDVAAADSLRDRVRIVGQGDIDGPRPTDRLAACPLPRPFARPDRHPLTGPPVGSRVTPGRHLAGESLQPLIYRSRSMAYGSRMSSPTPPGPRFMTLPQAAEELNVSMSQIYSLVRCGDLVGIQIGGRNQWRVERSKLEEYIERAYQRTAENLNDLPSARPDEAE